MPVHLSREYVFGQIRQAAHGYDRGNRFHVRRVQQQLTL